MKHILKISVCVLVVGGVSGNGMSASADLFTRGDVDRNGRIDVTDPLRIFLSLFNGEAGLGCRDAADANDSGDIDISDPVLLLSYLFVGGSAPSPPFPDMGADPTADGLDCAASMDPVRIWNQIAVDASGLDHTPVEAGEDRVFGEQLGPGRASRAMAIVHIAMFEVVNAVTGSGYRSYLDLPLAAAGVSLDAAVAQAAHDTLVALFPSQRMTFDARLEEELSRVEAGASRADGTRLGAEVAAAILALRAPDGSRHAEPRVAIEYITADAPGAWRQDPISEHPLALGAFWGQVRPFVLESGAQFRAPPPPALDSAEYAAAYDEALRMGGDGITTAHERSEDDTSMGIYWAYDGAPSLCAPPRLYNQIALEIADIMRSDMTELARLLALVNTAMADAGVAIWESKYHYRFWRPITGIREADAGTGPTGDGDGNPATVADPAFSPLGAPASNLTGPNFTPPFPAYPSGHAGFGGALFQTLRRFYGTDDIPFTFTSDEFNLDTRDNEGNLRPLERRGFRSLSHAEEENGQSRIYLGIHWAFDKTEGIAQGRRVADFVFERLFVPLE
jgi:membrane-associated phospholipid phosphatase